MPSAYVKPKKKKKAFNPAWMWAPKSAPPGYMGDLQCSHCKENLNRGHFSQTQRSRDYKRACYRCVANYEGSWTDFKNTALWARTGGLQARDNLSSTAGFRPVSGGWDVPPEGDDERPGVNVPGSAAYNARANGVPPPPSQPVRSASVAQNRPAPVNTAPSRQPSAPHTAAAAAGPSEPAASGSTINGKQQPPPTVDRNNLAETAWPSLPTSSGPTKSNAPFRQSFANPKVQSAGSSPKSATSVKPETLARKANGVVRTDFVKRAVISAMKANATAKLHDGVQSEDITKTEPTITSNCNVNSVETALKPNGVIQMENLKNTDSATTESVAKSINTNNVDSVETAWKVNGDIQAEPTKSAVKTELVDKTNANLASTGTGVDSPTESKKKITDGNTAAPIQPRARYLISIDQLTATSKRTALAHCARKLRLGLILYTGSRGFAMVEGVVANIESFLVELAAIKKSSSVRVKDLIPNDRTGERRKIVDDAGEPSSQEVRTLEDFVNRLKAADLTSLWNEHLALSKA
ncbi:hypothetical protein BDZ88DRAFT_408202 [Geranomyces variabilis]|nr:hypothetical protein BDZ88DRAFT_408202 [Geranomyces variabilis]KAJ3142252.1 hypothetical protein HDU90_004525 [Geranomyces variabilis]